MATHIFCFSAWWIPAANCLFNDTDFRSNIWPICLLNTANKICTMPLILGTLFELHQRGKFNLVDKKWCSPALQTKVRLYRWSMPRKFDNVFHHWRRLYWLLSVHCSKRYWLCNTVEDFEFFHSSIWHWFAFSEKTRERERQNKENLVPWAELKKIEADIKNEKSLLRGYQFLLKFNCNILSGKKFIQFVKFHFSINCFDK